MLAGQVLLVEDGLYLLGAGTAGDVLVLEDAGHVLDGSTLFKLTPVASSATGRWEPVTNGDPDNPALVFYEADVVMYQVTG